MHGAIAEAGIQPIIHDGSMIWVFNFSERMIRLLYAALLIVNSPLDSRLRGNDGGVFQECKPVFTGWPVCRQ